MSDIAERALSALDKTARALHAFTHFYGADDEDSAALQLVADLYQELRLPLPWGGPATISGPELVVFGLRVDVYFDEVGASDSSRLAIEGWDTEESIGDASFGVTFRSKESIRATSNQDLEWRCQEAAQMLARALSLQCGVLAFRAVVTDDDVIVADEDPLE